MIEGGSVFCESIEMGSFNFLVTCEPKVSIAQVVGDDDDDVGSIRCGQRNSQE